MVGLAGKTNLIAEFGRDLLAQGYTSVPNLLLRSYRSMGISDQEMIVLLHLVYLRSEQKSLRIVTESLQDLMSSPAREIEACLEQLQDKKVLDIDELIDAESLEMIQVYNLKGLFDKLAEVWALEKNNQYESQQKLLQAWKDKQRKTTNHHSAKTAAAAPGSISETAAKVYKSFENEFGRPLSPIEGELIMSWCDQHPLELVTEALRLSVLNGSFNLRYIERILQDWQRKNLRSLREVRQMEEAFLEKKAMGKRPSGRSTRATGSPKAEPAKEDKYRDMYSV